MDERVDHRRVDPELEREMVASYLTRFIPAARLSSRHAERLGATMTIESGFAPDGAQWLRLTGPSGFGGEGAGTWDGSLEAMRARVASYADTVADNVRWDQDNVGLTGLEPQFDVAGGSGEKEDASGQSPRRPRRSAPPRADAAMLGNSEITDKLAAPSSQGPVGRAEIGQLGGGAPGSPTGLVGHRRATFADQPREQR
jgi:hypothetical protein